MNTIGEHISTMDESDVKTPFQQPVEWLGEWIDPWREHRQVSYVVQFEPPAYIWRYLGT